jgi:hypothetical protein
MSSITTMTATFQTLSSQLSTIFTAWSVSRLSMRSSNSMMRMMTTFSALKSTLSSHAKSLVSAAATMKVMYAHPSHGASSRSLTQTQMVYSIHTNLLLSTMPTAIMTRQFMISSSITTPITMETSIHLNSRNFSALNATRRKNQHHSV